MKKILKLILFLGLIFILLPLTIQFSNINQTIDIKYSENEKKIKNSDFWDLTGTQIDIDDSVPTKDWAYTALNYDWCTGKGTWMDPYVIENVTIDGLRSGNCIRIKNSNVFFIIRNCILFNASSGGTDGGIKLEDTNNGILINNNCSYNGGSGISIISCNNNTFMGNIANNNGEYGIYVSDYSDHNTLL